MRIPVLICDICGYTSDPREKTGRERMMISIMRKDGPSAEVMYVPVLKPRCDKHVCINCAVMISQTLEKGIIRGADETERAVVPKPYAGSTWVEDATAPTPVVSGAGFEIRPAGEGTEKHGGQSKTVLLKSHSEGAETRPAGEGSVG